MTALAAALAYTGFDIVALRTEILRAFGLPIHRAERRFPRIWPNTRRGAHRADVR